MKIAQFVKDESLKILFEICSIINNYKANLSMRTLDFCSNIFAYLPADRIDYLAFKNDIPDLNAKNVRTSFNKTLKILKVNK